jgi:hypothetical protein
MALLIEKEKKLYEPADEVEKAKVFYEDLCESMKRNGVGEGLAAKVIAAIAAYGLDKEKISLAIGEPLASIEEYYNNLNKADYLDTENNAIVLDNWSNTGFKLATLVASGLVEVKYKDD